MRKLEVGHDDLTRHPRTSAATWRSRSAARIRSASCGWPWVYQRALSTAANLASTSARAARRSFPPAYHWPIKPAMPSADATAAIVATRSGTRAGYRCSVPPSAGAVASSTSVAPSNRRRIAAVAFTSGSVSSISATIARAALAASRLVCEFDVPIVTDCLEPAHRGVAGLDGTQPVELRAHSEQVGNALLGPEGSGSAEGRRRHRRWSVSRWWEIGRAHV